MPLKYEEMGKRSIWKRFARRLRRFIHWIRGKEERVEPFAGSHCMALNEAVNFPSKFVT